MGTQSQRLPPLDRLAVFDAAARHLPFTKAAAERFLTHALVTTTAAARRAAAQALCAWLLAQAREAS